MSSPSAGPSPAVIQFLAGTKNLLLPPGPKSRSGKPVKAKPYLDEFYHGAHETSWNNIIRVPTYDLLESELPQHFLTAARDRTHTVELVDDYLYEQELQRHAETPLVPTHYQDAPPGLPTDTDLTPYLFDKPISSDPRAAENDTANVDFSSATMVRSSGSAPTHLFDDMMVDDMPPPASTYRQPATASSSGSSSFSTQWNPKERTLPVPHNRRHESYLARRAELAAAFGGRVPQLVLPVKLEDVVGITVYNKVDHKKYDVPATVPRLPLSQRPPPRVHKTEEELCAALAHHNAHERFAWRQHFPAPAHSTTLLERAKLAWWWSATVSKEAWMLFFPGETPPPDDEYGVCDRDDAKLKTFMNNPETNAERIAEWRNAEPFVPPEWRDTPQGVDDANAGTK